MESRENPPQVTVLMTVFNGGQYLEKSIQSILGQTYKDFELLTIDDASTDNSLETIKSFHDDRIRLSSNKENMGQSKSLNIGLKLAKGKYVARIDADDIAFPKWLQNQYDFIESNSSYVAASANAVVIDEDNRVRRIYHSPTNQEDIILRSFTFSPINHVGSILNKKIILENGGYVEEYKIAADYGLWSKLIRRNYQIISTGEILIAIRAHSSSLSRSGSGARELQDLADIMRGNINQFTSSTITPEESLVLCRSFFDEGSLNDAEFRQAVRLLKKAYGSVVPSLNIDRASTQKWSKNRCLTVYLKRVYYAIGNKDYALVKDTLRRGIQEFGMLNPLGVLFAAYFLGKICLSWIPPISEELMRAKAYLMTKGKLRIAGL